PQLRPQRFPFHQFHHNVRTALELARVVYGDDVRMIQRRSGARLLRETLHALRVLAGLAAHHLAGDVPSDWRGLRAIDDTHSPFAEHFGDPVAPDGATEK